jgi:hypothetical protein
MNEPIVDVLRRLREDARAQSAPDVLEEKLLSVFREHHAARRRAGRKWFWVSSAAVAASLLLMLGWRLSPTTSIRVPQDLPQKVASAPKAAAPEMVVAVADTTPKPKIHKQRTQKTPKPVSAARIPPREFIRLPYAPEYDPYEGGQVVRVSMPGASVRNLGLPVLVDRVQADVLLGGDGVARGIRLVSNSGLNPEGR